jgi:hypothetical protein
MRREKKGVETVYMYQGQTATTAARETTPQSRGPPSESYFSDNTKVTLHIIPTNLSSLNRGIYVVLMGL